MKTVGMVALVAVLGLFLLGCGNQPPMRGAAAVSGPVASPPVRTATKLLVVVEENHSLSQMREGMPYTYALAKQYGYASHYDALAHPSLPNYIAIATGSTRGIRDDARPAEHSLRGRSVFGQAIAHGRSTGVYAEGMPSACALEDSLPYVVRHNPWAYFGAERDECFAHDLPFEDFAGAVADGQLPRAGMVIPDVDSDAHDGTLAEADDWFQDLMSTVFAGPDWQSGHLVVVLTADEDDRAHHNRVLTVVIHPSQHHHVVTAPLTHRSLARLYAEVTHVPVLPAATSAPSMSQAFGLPVL